jgi:hypothetical protein
MTAQTDKLAALATMPLAQLRGEWLQAFKEPAPEGVGRPLLTLGVAYRLQERLHGRLSAAAARNLERLAKKRERNEDLPDEVTSRFKLGTRLVREWRGEVHQVELTDRGYLYRDSFYPSLSQIARQITGAQWSGPRFFGLKQAARQHG